MAVSFLALGVYLTCPFSGAIYVCERVCELEYVGYVCVCVSLLCHTVHVEVREQPCLFTAVDTRLAGLQASRDLPDSASLFPVKGAGITEVLILAQACMYFTHWAISPAP